MAEKAKKGAARATKMKSDIPYESVLNAAATANSSRGGSSSSRGKSSSGSKLKLFSLRLACNEKNHS